MKQISPQLGGQVIAGSPHQPSTLFLQLTSQLKIEKAGFIAGQTVPRPALRHWVPTNHELKVESERREIKLKTV